ncbi:MAG TPA: penicillin acylase family protein [Hypericibacter adhaerens]|uniref:Penicillin amidase n=1 Tax=Hypericibacter adhaerens TaxID=2602016 RepID=A0A5J6N873_9PROT|nr:penicillin acylase family protein [Hypericibacter adhaerens]QEX25163.1 penicillin amidase [Hypericibacter adhaerens]HWA42023.1 penicillin acylase family protein [Hypericibacter adhaerens]
MARLLPASLALLLLTGCSLLTPLPPPTTLAQRLAMFPTAHLPLDKPARIYWDDHQIPFVEAETDHDAAFLLGLVHAHLRLGQMEIMRHIAEGRLAELGGPLAVDIDKSLRILDLGKASPAILAAMPSETRAWLDAFVAGINYYQEHAAPLPHEYALLGLKREPWRPEEIITVGRLASVDVTWLIWFRLLRYRDSPEWPALWTRIAGRAASSAPSFATPGEGSLGLLETLFTETGKTGSNSLAVGATRTTSGSAIIASDPHLGLSLPNLWLIAGIQSPSYHAVGLMVPGLPFVAVGRNPWIAWGGTNLRAASSDIFDISSLPADQLATHKEKIRVRWWFDSEAEIRESPYGPVISDAPLLPHREGETLALSWIGHRPSDEMTAMLGVNRARDWNDFRQALAGFALSPQNFIYADAKGNVGQVTATQLPARPDTPPPDIVRPLSDAAAWQRIVTSQDLPSSYDPPQGFVASANNRPAGAPIRIGYFFSANDRIQRLQALLGARRDWTAEDLKRLQLDTYMQSSVTLRDALKARLMAANAFTSIRPEEQRVLDLVAGWDGNYAATSQGPVAFEALMAGLIGALYDETERGMLDAGGNLYDVLAQDLPHIPDDRLTAALRKALPEAAKAVADYPDWGAMHRLPLQHMLGGLPVIGGRYRFGDRPASGSSETLDKTAHDITAEQNQTRYGTQARHVSDLADPDANWFVLLGGQDGWFNSANFLDQVDPFMQGELIQVPLRIETVRARFAHRLDLTP